MPVSTIQVPNLSVLVHITSSLEPSPSPRIVFNHVLNPAILPTKELLAQQHIPRPHM